MFPCISNTVRLSVSELILKLVILLTSVSWHTEHELTRLYNFNFRKFSENLKKRKQFSLFLVEYRIENNISLSILGCFARSKRVFYLVFNAISYGYNII